jgi:hypothetical protein
MTELPCRPVNALAIGFLRYSSGPISAIDKVLLPSVSGPLAEVDITDVDLPATSGTATDLIESKTFCIDSAFASSRLQREKKEINVPIAIAGA